MYVHEILLRGYIQRCKEIIAICEAKKKFINEIWSMYESGLLSSDEFDELIEMV